MTFSPSLQQINVFSVVIDPFLVLHSAFFRQHNFRLFKNGTIPPNQCDLWKFDTFRKEIQTPLLHRPENGFLEG